LAVNLQQTHVFYYYYYYAAFNAPCVCHKDDESQCLNIPPNLKYVATLSCEIRMSEKWHQSEICIVINDKSQGSRAKHSKNDELLYYIFIAQSAAERIFNIGERLTKLQANW